MNKKELRNLENVKRSKNGNTIYRFGDINDESIKAKIHSIWSENEKENSSYNGWLKDDTNEIRFSLMFDPEVVPNKGDLVKINSFVISEYSGDTTILIYKQTDVDIIRDKEEGCPDRKPYDRKPDIDDICNLDIGYKNVHLIGRVTNVTELNPWGELKKQAVLKDRSGSINLKIWFYSDISNGDVIHIKGSYIKKYLGDPEIELRTSDFLEKLPDDVIETEETLDKIHQELNSVYQRDYRSLQEVVSK